MKSKLLLIQCKRHEIPILKEWKSAALKRLDKNLECFLHEGTGKWELYLVTMYGGVSSDDTLFHQFTFPGEPGSRLINDAQKGLAIARNYGRLDDEEAKKYHQKRMQDVLYKKDQQREKDILDISGEMRKIANRLITRGWTMPMTKPRKQTVKPGRKLIDVA